MPKYQKKPIVLLLIVAVFLLLFRDTTAQALTIDDITSDSIKDMENQIEDSKDRMDELASSITDLESMLKSLESDKKDLAAAIEALDSDLAKVNDRLDELVALVAEKEEQIAVTTEQLIQAEAVEADQYESMKERIRFMYEKGETLLVELIFESSSFAEVLNKSEYIAELTSYDRNMLVEYQNTVETIHTMKAVLEADKELLDVAKAQEEEEQEKLETLIAQKQTLIEKAEADINTKELTIAQYEAEIAAEDAKIADLETSLAEERKAIALANGYKLEYDGSTFTWPAPSYTRVSCDYGWRIHPILGVQQFHNGIDLASPSGTPIVAAYWGVVAAAGYSSTMGNYVILDHGSGVTTIYMHASKLLVEEGDLVKSGEQIAKVGSTGRSTGPHLHFGVRKDGVYQSPWNYLN